MFQRYFFNALACAALIVSTGFIAAAQTGQLRGHVVMKGADAKPAPVAGATIDVFRVDVTGKYETKTNKKGEFVFAGLPFIGEYIISASAPGAQPGYVPQVKAGRDVNYQIELYPGGDGKRLTQDEIRAYMARSGASSSGDTKLSAEEAAKRDELIKQNAEIEAANKRAESSNAIIDRAFKAGNASYAAKNYDAAITSYDEGLTADPEHPGALALLTNKSAALRVRGVERYNAALKLTDDAAKAAAMDAAKKDWREATEAGTKAVAMSKAMPAPATPAPNDNARLNLYFALSARAEALRLFVVKVDQSKVDDGIAAYQEYIAAETDAVKKAKFQSDLAQMLFDANQFDKALVEYQKILATNPDDLNALLRAGQALFNIGAINNSDKDKYQEAANYLGQFISKAPDTDPLKADAKAILDALKAQADVKPEKPAPAPRRPRRP